MSRLRTGVQVHQALSQQDLARAQSVSRSSLFLENPDTYGEEAAYWLDTDHPGKLVSAFQLVAIYEWTWQAYVLDENAARALCSACDGLAARSSHICSGTSVSTLNRVEFLLLNPPSGCKSADLCHRGYQDRDQCNNARPSVSCPGRFDVLRCSSSRNLGSKVELEALYTLGMDALTGRFLETAVLRGDFI